MRDGDGGESIFMRLLEMNRPEWKILALGCLTSAIAGATHPILSLLILKLVLVS